MRISDWSSDVCSSDLGGGDRRGAPLAAGRAAGVRLAPAEFSGGSGDRGRYTLRGGRRRNARDRRASRLGNDSAETCRAARVRADAVPAAARGVLAGVAEGDARAALKGCRVWGAERTFLKIGGAACRERVCRYV